VIVTTPKGNTLKIGQIKNFAYRERDWQGEEEKINIVLVKNGRGREVPLVTLDGNALGVLDKESAQELKQRNLLTSKGLNLVARLQNSPPTTAQIQIKPETVVYPWQQREQLEAKRASYREKYEAYTSDVLKSSAFVGVSRQEIDTEVAIRAYADTKDIHEVASILSQSDRVRELRATVADACGWEEYIKQAQDYIRQVQADARQRFSPVLD
jgi:hypothetical protein